MTIFTICKPILLRVLLYSCLLITVSIVLLSGALSGEHNGFKLTSPLIPVAEIHHGGPPKDGIPAIDKPKFIKAEQAGFLNKRDRILGILTNIGYKAYPLKILNWHEIVNDGDLLISYCPLCGTGMVFKVYNADFGVSGLLYNNDMLLYDRQTESLWSQIMARAISGERKGQVLEMLAVENTSWEHWSEAHPDTWVLSNSSGFFRDYSKSPYGNYETSSAVFFPLTMRSEKFHPKEKVIGIQHKTLHKAYPFVELGKSTGPVIYDEIAGEAIEIHFNSQHHSGSIKRTSGEVIPTITSYWFAWFAFHPDTQIYRHQDK